MLLQLTAKCVQTGNQINIQFVQDASQFARLLKTSERLLWIDYGACLDVESFDKIFDKRASDIIVFPAVKEGINWTRFADGVKTATTEPLSQVGLDFDTVVDKKIEDGMYAVKSTAPSVFVVLDCTKTYEKLREKKGEGIKLPSNTEEIFQKCVEKGVKVHAYTKCNVLRHYSHECVGNILEAVGISCRKE